MTKMHKDGLYSLERLSKRLELEAAGIKMLTFSLGATSKDGIRDEDIRGTEHGRCFGDKVRLRCFGRVQRRDSDYICS